MNMSAADLAALRFATQSTSQTLIDTLIAAGKYNWQAFGSHDTSAPGPTRGLGNSPISPSSCLAFMTEYCNATHQAEPMLQHMGSSVNASVAAFLITRSPYAYLGWGWESGDEKWDNVFLLQAGEPTGLCAQVTPGVFTRPWTNGVASLDCGSFVADLPFPSL